MSYIIDAFDTGHGHFTIQPTEEGGQFQLKFVPSLTQHFTLDAYPTREAARDAIVARTTRYEDWDTMDDTTLDQRL